MKQERAQSTGRLFIQVEALAVRETSTGAPTSPIIVAHTLCLYWIIRLIQTRPLASKGVEYLRAFHLAEALAAQDFDRLPNQFRVAIASVVSLTCFQFLSN